MKTAKEVLIDDVKYTLGHWDVEKSLETWAWLIESLGDGVNGLFELWKEADAAKTDKGDMDEDQKKVALQANIQFALKGFELILRTLQAKVPPDIYKARMMSFCTDVAGPNGRVQPKTEFMGRLLHMHKLAFEVLRFQYQDFFDEALSVFK